MRRSYRHCRRRKRGAGVVKAGVFLLLLCVICGYVTYYTSAVIRPTIDQIAEIRARSLITLLINETLYDKFKQETDVQKLLVTRTNNEGSIELVQADTQAMNLLISELSKELQKKYREIKATTIKLPLGTILGSRLMSQSGPYINMKVLPTNVTRMDFQTEFITEGINQTKYKVYVILESNAKVLAPFSDKTIKIESTVLIAEAVILGKVPTSYVVVPKDNTLDALSID